MKTTILLAILCLFSLSCTKEKDMGVPYKFQSLVEIKQNTDTISRTNEVLLCVRDDDFFVPSDGSIFIELNNTKCAANEPQGVGGQYEILELPGRSGEFMELGLPTTYVLHDSFRLSFTSQQFADREEQFYKLIRFDEEEIILQSIDSLTRPFTQNIWQVTYGR